MLARRLRQLIGFDHDEHVRNAIQRSIDELRTTIADKSLKDDMPQIS
jgi:hypothetical protein